MPRRGRLNRSAHRNDVVPLGHGVHHIVDVWAVAAVLRGFMYVRTTAVQMNVRTLIERVAEKGTVAQRLAHRLLKHRSKLAARAVALARRALVDADCWLGRWHLS